MTLPGYLVATSLLLGLSFAVFQVIVKHAYLRHGRLGIAVGLLQALMWGPFFVFPYLYNPADWAWFWAHPHPQGPGALVAALVLLVTGVGLVVVGMAQLGLPHAVGARATSLHTAGLYRLTRNPQVVAGAPLVAGLALLWPSWYALGWVAIYLAMAHMMVRAEEAHLRRRHGEAYDRYCARVPRYLGRSRWKAGEV